LLAEAENARNALNEARTELENAQQTLANEPSEQHAQAVDEFKAQVSSAETRVNAADKAVDDHRAYVADRIGEQWNVHLDNNDTRVAEQPGFEEKTRDGAHKVINAAEIALTAAGNIPGSPLAGAPVSEFAEKARLATDAAYHTAKMNPIAMDAAARTLADGADSVNDVAKTFEDLVVGTQQRDEAVATPPEREAQSQEATRAQEPPDPRDELQQQHLKEIISFEQNKEQLQADMVKDLKEMGVGDDEIARHVAQQEQQFDRLSEQMAQRHHEEREALREPEKTPELESPSRT